jgi:hypothetical protein
LSLEYFRSPTSDKEVNWFLRSHTVVICHGASVQNLHGCECWTDMNVCFVIMNYFVLWNRTLSLVACSCFSSLNVYEWWAFVLGSTLKSWSSLCVWCVARWHVWSRLLFSFFTALSA